jgi:hypothetical protein
MTIPSPFTGSLCETRTHIPIVHQKPVKRKGRGLARISKKHSKELREYNKVAKQFLKDHPYCQHWMMEHLVLTDEGRACGMTLQDCEMLAKARPCNIPRSTEIHHMKGRGRFLLDTSTFLACRPDHATYIHLDPKRYEKGYCLPRR